MFDVHFAIKKVSPLVRLVALFEGNEPAASMLFIPVSTSCRLGRQVFYSLPGFLLRSLDVEDRVGEESCVELALIIGEDCLALCVTLENSVDDVPLVETVGHSDSPLDNSADILVL
jgi:hypothetical protein